MEKRLVKTYPTQVVILVMDNASCHYSAKVQAALRLFEHRVGVFWLPQYCPELNVMERFWLHLKQTVVANKLYLTIDALRKALLRVLQRQNDLSSSDRLTFSNSFSSLL